jgi:putative nucleotidyltransferase with HDIG domain
MSANKPEQNVSQVLKRLFPIINKIAKRTLRQRVLDVYADALAQGGWKPGDLKKIPGSLLIPNCPFSYWEHTNAVTHTALAIMQQMKKAYGKRITIDRDTLIAGGLLHDIGKLLEIQQEKGTYKKSLSGRLLRHPFSGLPLAAARGIPDTILHIIACHSKEGETTRRTVEATIIHHADFVNFDPFKP